MLTRLDMSKTMFEEIRKQTTTINFIEFLNNFIDVVFEGRERKKDFYDFNMYLLFTV